MGSSVLLLGVDGGGTGCRARLTDRAGTVLGEGEAGPANVRFGLTAAFTQILRATDQCLEQAGVDAQPGSRSSPAWRWPASATSPGMAR